MRTFEEKKMARVQKVRCACGQEPVYFSSDFCISCGRKIAFETKINIARLDHGVFSHQLFSECAENGGHEYAEKTCPKCSKVFCYQCCSGQNVDQGGKHEPDFMSCPECGQDYYAE